MNDSQKSTTQVGELASHLTALATQAKSIESLRLIQLKAWDHAFESKLDALEPPHEPQRLSPEGWFLGPKAENEDLLRRLVNNALSAHVHFRKSFFQDDPSHITPALKETKSYTAAIQKLESHAASLFELLQSSTPFASMRYQGHMVWDQALPAVVGYFAAMLYNQNNVATEASPVTTQLEITVCDQLCRMLGYAGNDGHPASWGHLTSDGSVANIEAMWALRNARYLPLALVAAIQSEACLSGARYMKIDDARDPRVLCDTEPWPLLNLPLDIVLGLPERVCQHSGLSTAQLTQVLQAYTLEHLGWLELANQHPEALKQSPVVMVPATRHYSWPKAATLLGLGSQQLLSVKVTQDARMDTATLRVHLEKCLNERRPVIAVVVVIGSTEESAVDPLEEILTIRASFRARGLDFAIHCDAAWGGYFASMLRGTEESNASSMDAMDVPIQPLSEYVRRQYQALSDADSITVDPHKAGYIPYPAGAICYRDSRLRDRVSLKAPVVFHGSEPTVGIYGVEGSRPGAAAAAVYLAHQVIGLNREGYGRILGQCLWTSKRLYCRLMTLKDPRFSITLLQRLPAEILGSSHEEAESQRRYIESFASDSNTALYQRLRNDTKAQTLFNELGSDQVILSFCVNALDSQGNPQKDLQKMNTLNNRIFDLCSLLTCTPKRMPELILTASTFDPSTYGHAFVDAFCHRAGVNSTPNTPVSFLISTTMDPWTTATDNGDFLDIYVQALTRTVHLALDEINGTSPSTETQRP